MERKKTNGYARKILYMIMALAMMIIMLPSKSLAASNNLSYTVEFTYGEKQYVMNGDTTIPLSDILDYVGLSGEASSVRVSDASLFSASKVGGEWTVTAHQAFHTEEWMKVTIDGVVYEIVVMDATVYCTYTINTSAIQIKTGDILEIGDQIYVTKSYADLYARNTENDSYETIKNRWGYDGVTESKNYWTAEKRYVVSDAQIDSGTSTHSDKIYLTAIKEDNTLTYTATQSFSKNFSTSSQTASLATASDGQGTVSYAINSQKQGSTTVSYFTISGTTLTIAASTPVGTYTVVVRATAEGNDNYNSGTKDSTVTVTVGKADNSLTYTATQSISKNFSTSSQTASLATASNGQGTVSYAINSQKQGSTTVSYFTLNGTTLTIAANTPVGTYTVVVRATAAGNNNYNSGTKDSTVTVTVGKAANPLSFASTQSVSKTYSKSDQTQTLTAATGNQGDLSYAINSQKDSSNSDVTYFSLSGTILTVAANTPAGTYTVVVRSTATGNDNYNSGTADSTVTVTINPKDVTVSGITAGNKVYDRTTTATLNTSGASFDGLLSGDSLTVSATGTFNNKDVGTGKTVTISGLTLGGTSANNYKLTSSGQQTSATANITAKALTVTAEAKTKVYGTDDPALTYTHTGLISGDSFTGSLSREAGSDVGTYAITQGTLTAGSNYAITYTGANFTITQATPNITGIAENNLTYNKTEQALVTEGSTTGGILKYAMTTKDAEAPAADTYTDSVPTAMRAGTYTVYYKVVGNNNYFDVAPAYVDVTIAQKEITISGITAEDKIYDKTTDATLDYSEINWISCGMVAGDKLTISATGTFTDAGASADKTVNITDLTLGGTSIDDYVLADGSVQQKTAAATIHQKVVGLEWYVGDTVYGDDDTPAFTYNGIAQKPTAVATGLISGDSCNVTISGAQTDTNIKTETDNYTATASALSNLNYALPTVTTKAFVINPINIKTDDKVIFDLGGTEGHYTFTGVAITPAIRVSANLSSGADTILVKDTDYALSRDTSAIARGRYIVKIDGTGNYTGTVYKAWNIDAKTITVTADDNSKTYGDNDPAFTVTVYGASAEDIIYSIERTAGENAGEYAITVTGDPEQDDYIVNYVNGTFTINRADVTVTADDKKKSYGDADPELTATVTGLKRGDTENVISYTLNRAEGEATGDYTITPSGEDEQDNYNVSYETGTLTIGKRKLSSDFVRLKVVSFKYDGKNKIPEIVFDGFEVTNGVDYTLSGEQTANDEGMHSITITGKGNNFYGSITLNWFITGVGDEKVIYDGQPHSISVKEGTEVTYKQADGSYTDVKPYFTDAGRYTVEYKTTVDNPLYEYFPDEEEPTIEVNAESVLTIEPKAVTVTAEDKSKIRGEAEPEYTWTVEGLLAPDTEDILTVSIGRTSNDNDNIGPHAIIPSGVKVQGNYAVTYVNGILTISAKSAASEDITVGQSEEETLTYTGESLKPTIVIKDGNDDLIEDTDGDGEQPGDYTVTYEGVSPTVYPNSSIPPVNAGTYKAVITFKDNYTGAREVEYSVAKAVPTITTNPTPSGITYGQTLADSVLTGGVGSVGGTFAWENATIKPSVSDSNITGFTVVFTPTDSVNYENATADVTITVNKATTDKSVLTDDNKPVPLAELQYNNDEQGLVTAPKELPDGYTGVQYRLSDTDEWSDNIPTGKDVGDYTVQVKYIGDENHNDLVADPVPVSVSRKAVTVKADDISKNYGDADPELTATFTGTLGDDTVVYTVSRAAGEAIGTYTITPSGAALQGNYDVTYETGVFEVLGKSADSESITAFQAENETLVYNGTSKKPTITVKDGDTVLDEDTDGDGTDDDGVYSITYEGVAPTVYPGEVGDEKEPPTNVGTYNVVITFKTPYTGTRKVQYEVAKATPTIMGVPTVQGITYGQKLDDSEITGGEVTGTGDVVISGIFSWEDGMITPSVSDSGVTEYTIVFTPEDENYEEITVPVKVTIGKAVMDKDDLAGDEKPEGKTGTEYNNQEQELVTAPEELPNGYEKVMYRLSDTDEWSEDIPKGKEAGTYTVHVKYIGDENNDDFEGDDITVSIARKAVTVKADDKSKNYGDADPELTATVTGIEGNDTVEYELSRADGEKVNTYTITPSGEGIQGNYTVSYQPGTLTIDSKSSASEDITAERKEEEELVYTGAPVKPAIVVKDDDTILKEDPDGDGEQPGDYTISYVGVEPAVYPGENGDGTIPPVNAGTYKAVITFKDNYTGKKEVEYSVSKYVPEVTLIPQVNEITYGQKLDDSVITGGEATGLGKAVIPGVFRWKDGIEKPDVSDSGTTEYLVVFTPEDKTNYEEVTAKVVVSIARKAVTVKADDKSKKYGEADPELTATVTGTVGNDTVEYGLSRVQGEKVNTYTITPNGEEIQGNYTVLYQTGTLTITKAEYDAPPAAALTIIKASDDTTDDGRIEGLDSKVSYQYSEDGGKTWKDVESGETSINVKAGTYKIRVAGDDDHNSSIDVEVTVGVTSRTRGVVNFKKENGTEQAETSVTAAKSSSIETFAKTQVEEGSDVKVELEITPKNKEEVRPESVEEIGGKVKKVFAGIESDKIRTEYLEIDLAKYVDNLKQGNISDTGAPLEIELSYDSNKMGNPIIIRTHNGTAKAFEKLAGRPAENFRDATFYISDGIMYLYSQFFSDFAIVYATEKTYYVSIDIGEDEPVTQVVGESGKIDLPTGLTKDGYAFGGWYKDEEYTYPWNEDMDTVSGDTTIYGKWNKSVTGLKVTPESVTFKKAGETAVITAYVEPSDAADTKVTFTSSDTNVATVDTDGKITAVANGTAVITVTTEDGAKTATVKVTVAIPEIKQQGTDVTVTKTQVDKNSLAMNEGLKIDQKGSKINIRWGRVEDADGYEVYVAYCGTNFNKKKPAKTIKNNKTVSATITKINGKKLDLKKNYKLYVIAYKLFDGKKLIQAKSITGHIVGRKNVAYTNVKAIKLTKTKYTIKVGKTAKIKAKTVLVEKGKKQLSNAHAKEFRYASSNNSIATVDKKGKVKGVAKGTCTIYVYARNGYAKKIKVTVK